MNTDHTFERRYRLIREIIETIILTVLMFVIINLAVQNYDVDGPSMEPTLHNQQRIMVDKISYKFQTPSRGDVIVFLAPPNPTLNYVKRIVGVPGDIVSVKKTTVILNGITLQETYVDPQYQGNFYPDVVNLRIPEGMYFVMGDDRANSSDSRDWGLLPRENIVGRAALIYWPLGQDNTGFLPNVSSVYAEADKQHKQSEQKTLNDPSGVFLPVYQHEGVLLVSAAPLLIAGVAGLRRRRRPQSCE